MGNLGVSEDMRAIWEAMSVCFWLVDAVTSNAPEERHLEALTRLYSHLKPDLMKKPWPSPAYRQNPPQRQWPTSKGIIHYYKIWWGKKQKTNIYIYIYGCKLACNGFCGSVAPCGGL